MPIILSENVVFQTCTTQHKNAQDILEFLIWNCLQSPSHHVCVFFKKPFYWSMTDIKKLDIFNTYNLMKRVSFFVFNKLRGQERIMTEDEWGRRGRRDQQSRQYQWLLFGTYLYLCVYERRGEVGRRIEEGEKLF